MRRAGRLAPVGCCLLAALAPEAQAQEGPAMAGDTAANWDPFEVCKRVANLKIPEWEWENPEYVWWERCLDEVSRGGADGWRPFTAEEVYDYLIAAEAADWGVRDDGKKVSVSCTAH